MDKDELLKRRDELRKRIEAIRRDLGSGLDRDMEEQAQQLENYDTLLEIARVAEVELRQVEEALARKDGDEQ
jgi:RNA polymerase-binding transcription factor DksA